jgi:hypothetical protein
MSARFHISLNRLTTIQIVFFSLVWTFPFCMQMWRRFSKVLSFDNTYNTNRFKLPLFQVTGQTCIGSVFNAAWGLIDNKRLNGFQFLAGSIRQLLNQHHLRTPNVAITDFNDAMKAALAAQFPDTQQQICIHHIHSNVLLQARRRWVQSDRAQDQFSDGQGGSEPNSSNAKSIPHSPDGIHQRWKIVAFAETEEQHD